MTTPISQILARFLGEALEDAVATGRLPQLGSISVEIEKARHKEHGDFASGVAFQLSRATKKTPMEVAELIVEGTSLPPYLNRMKAEPPGFINFFISEGWLRDNVAVIEEQKGAYGSSRRGSGQRVQVEFVSTNPNGPLHVGHARGAVIGSTLANLLEKGGYEVQREYYVNDGGSQMLSFAHALHSRIMELLGESVSFKSDSYAGKYTDELANRAAADEELKAVLRDGSQEQALRAVMQFGLDTVLADIRKTLERLGVSYDNWFSEKSLLDTGIFNRIMERLDKDGYISRSDGAVWFRTTKCGAEQDDVLIRSGDAGHTYFATDIAYHYDKLAERKFDKVINIWGSDHHSHITRLKAALEVLGCDPDKLVILLTQMVHLQEGEESVKLSKRAGSVVTADTLLDNVGRDASRYVFLSRGAASQMTFDIELAKKKSNENPIYYVQYAHARLSSILRAAASSKIQYNTGDLGLLKHQCELDLMRCLAEFPEMLNRAIANLEPHHLPHYAYELARVLQRFYEECRVISNDPAEQELSKARLRLVENSKTVLAETLRLMGMTAPDSM